jgi:AcrR family transcriptional regulator
MTAKRIKEIALAHFAKNGYNGASLADIAEEVGIKKPSIYSHFKGKDDLFLTVIESVTHDELAFVTHFFESNETLTLHDRLYQFLIQYTERYEKVDKTKFLLRMAFFPPVHLHDQIMNSFYSYLDKVESLLLPIFAQAVQEKEICSITAEIATTAFLGLLDGILVELLYGGQERFEKRLHASWHIFWSGIKR